MVVHAEVGLIQKADALQALLSFVDPQDGAAMKSLDLTRKMVEKTDAPFSRNQFTPGHVTCTALVLHPARDRVLLVHHRRLNMWLLPGGHIEKEDASLEDAAAREAVEETGVVLARSSPARVVSVDVHGIPPGKGEPYHLHHDLVFALQAAEERFEVAEEVRDVAWCGFGEFDRYQLKESIRLAVARVR
jgi:8-oxo-dGTP pyrophosphatase MutT (NUDIX family)